MSDNIIQVNQDLIHTELKDLVRTVTKNAKDTDPAIIIIPSPLFPVKSI